MYWPRIASIGSPDDAPAPPTALVFAERGTPPPKRLSKKGAMKDAAATKGSCGPGINLPMSRAVFIPVSTPPAVPPAEEPPPGKKLASAPVGLPPPPKRDNGDAPDTDATLPGVPPPPPCCM